VCNRDFDVTDNVDVVVTVVVVVFAGGSGGSAGGGVGQFIFTLLVGGYVLIGDMYILTI